TMLHLQQQWCGVRTHPQEHRKHGPRIPTGGGHLLGHTNPSQHPVLLLRHWGPMDATRILPVLSSGRQPTHSG
ncbi:unnamed protein product, partial [Bubo scandiacus]